MATGKGKSSSSKTKQSRGSTKGFIDKIHARISAFLGRRPHRSFKMTKHRDYKRSLDIPGYWSLTKSVFNIIRQNKKKFLLLALIYAAMNILVMGLASQEKFIELQDNISIMGQEIFEGNWSSLGTAAMLTLSTITGNVAPSLSEAQQVYAVFFGLMVWLTTVWLLRQHMAGYKVRLRDGLYNAGAPIIATLIVALIIVIQFIPALLAAVGFAAAQTSGLLEGGVEAMLFWVVATALVVLSVYWITSSILAMVVVTLPGMYPMKALKIAGDMVTGRRLRILYRFAWMIMLLAVFWVVVLVPIILIDIGVKSLWPGIEWLPVIPLIVVLLTTVSLVWMASYTYVLYRKITEDDSKPA